MNQLTNKPTNQQTNKPTNQPPTHPTITVETALWIIAGIVALAMRLIHLDAALLNEREAHGAMLAWRAVTGQGMPVADYSPLLFAVNALLFALCGAGDVLARLGPALFGSLLALTPILLRQRIGRVGALVAGFYLAFSPTVLVASRRLDGAVVAALGGMVFLGGLVRFFDTNDAGTNDTGERLWLILSAGGVALAVTSSSSAYGLLLALSLAWLGLAWAWRSGAHVPRSAFHVSHPLLAFLLFVLAFSTGLGWNPAGLGAVGDLLPAWIARFGPAPNPVASPLALLIVYEPFALLLGLGGLVWAIRHRRRFSALLGVWAGVGYLSLILMPGRAVLDVLWVLLPLTLLTGVAVERFARSLLERGEWLSEGLHVPVVIILWVHLYLVLIRYAFSVSGDVADLALALMVVALQGLLTVMFALATKFDAALRAVAAGTGIVLLVVTISAGWGVAYVRPADPRELLVDEPIATGVRDLEQTLRDLSWRETGVPETLPFTLEAAPDDSVLAWYLRDFSAARRVEHLNVGEETSAVLVTRQRDLPLTNVVGDAEAVGQDFVLSRTWDPLEIECTWGWPPHCKAAVGWALLRKTPSPPTPSQWAVLWWLQDGGGE
ncbi:MAG: hypothetical protein SXV54_23985 [Chloroflexota bacterium]|nr:hypothetical protein [Chloroflexota bacterium]